MTNSSLDRKKLTLAQRLKLMSRQAADMDNPLNRNLQLLIESGLIGMLAKHMKNRRDLKAAGQVDIPKAEAKSLGMDPEKGFMTEWNTDMGIKDTAKVIPGSNQANVDTFFQGTEQANYKGNTNLAGNLPDINQPPKISTPNVDLGKMLTENPNMSAFDLAKAQLPKGATGLSNINPMETSAATLKALPELKGPASNPVGSNPIPAGAVASAVLTALPALLGKEKTDITPIPDANELKTQQELDIYMPEIMKIGLRKRFPQSRLV